MCRVNFSLPKDSVSIVYNEKPVRGTSFDGGQYLGTEEMKGKQMLTVELSTIVKF